ncbi:MAG: dienelactone hydrolase family protein [Ferruginibacter sp.]|nr:dienelactone hydrolase family protein [Cytophagales bacterium]
MFRNLSLCFCSLLCLSVQASFAQQTTLERLEKSPRHQEWVTIQQGERRVQAFVVYPEVKAKATAVIVIHENRGLNDWARSLADQVAEAGYIAIAPDLLSGLAPGGGKTADFPNPDAAREALYKLTPEQVTADLGAVRQYVAKLPAANGKVAVMGFCWGGGQCFRFATNQPDLAAAFVFYGTGPEDQAAVQRIKTPVYGFYGGDDARVNATIPASEALMKTAGKKYEPVVYEGAGHGFMRAGEEPDATEANRKARTEAWNRLKVILPRL